MDFNINGHSFIQFKNSNMWYKCIKCKIEFTYYQNNPYGKYYYNPSDEYPDPSLSNITCDEVIIKNIIE